ncbi:MAG: hypothetical protein A2137_07385 [Chloroflexi bacterium RBG_16_58_8]|nr:MAG: hypothetical protein A2137_07385 [Chloroflexi bacterium RBG_16_58_8]
MLKLFLSFVSGIVISGLLLFGAKTVIPTRAETDNGTIITENVTQSLINLIPDIEKIYRQSLTEPFQKAKSKIYDPDIANFYDGLLDSTGLNPTPGLTN